MRSVTTVKASKCVCDRSSALDPLRELTALPQTPELDMREEKGYEREMELRERKEGKGRGWKGR